MSISVPADEAIAPLQGRQVVTAAAASIFAWGLDLFDLFILLYVAPTVGKLFFPVSEPMLSLAAAYASFAVTLLVRPIGAALIGAYADVKGRRQAMMVAVTGVGVFTAVFGLLPTVATIGWWATALFLAFRVVQGIFVGGVVASSHTIGTESVPEKWRGLISGTVGGGGSAIGGLVASLAFYAVSLMAPGEAFDEWGWRLMFFSGLLTSIVGLLLFRNLEELPFFKQMAARRAARKRSAIADVERGPVRQMFSKAHFSVFAINVLMTLGAGGGYYLTSGYMPTFLNLVKKVPSETASMILIGVSVASAFGSMSCGALSQVIGRKKVFVGMALVRLVAFPTLFFAMARTSDLVQLGCYAALLTFIANGSYGPLLIFLNERFPTSLRATGTGLSWSVGFAIGGILPTFVSLASPSPASLPTSLAIFTTAVSVVYLVGALIIPETKGALERL